MARFRFQLEPVLAHRKRLRDEKQRQLAMLTGEKVGLGHQLSQLHELVSEDRHRMADGLVGVVDVGRIREHAAHAAQVVMRAAQITSHQHQLDTQIGDARSALVEAAKGHRVLEQFRNKRHAAWVDDQARLERKESDELASVRYVFDKERF